MNIALFPFTGTLIGISGRSRSGMFFDPLKGVGGGRDVFGGSGGGRRGVGRGSGGDRRGSEGVGGGSRGVGPIPWQLPVMDVQRKDV